MPRILIVTNGELVGDGVHKLPFLKALRSAFPGFEIVYWTPPGTNQFAKDLWPLSHDLIDKNIEFPLTWQWRKKGPESLKKTFTFVLDLQHRIKNSIYLLGSLRKQEKYFSLWQFKGKRKGTHILDKIFASVPWPQGFDPIPERYFHHPEIPPELEASWASFFQTSVKAWVGFVPGAGSRHKCWPLSHFITTAHNLHEREIGSVFVLGPQDVDFYQELKAQCPWALFPLQDGPDFSGCKILRTVSLTPYLACTVAHDAGGGHILSLGHQPHLVLYGPTRESKSNPRRSGVSSLRAPGELMDQLSPQQVLAWLNDQLPGTQRTSDLPSL